MALETGDGKYVPQNVRGPRINVTYMTLDSLQQLHVMNLQNETQCYQGSGTASRFW
jgi:hypothetical protein